MKSEEFKILLVIQLITLLLVVILFFNNLKKSDSGIAMAGAAGVPIGANQASGPVQVSSKNDYVFGDTAATNFLMVFSRYNCGFCRYFYNHVFDSLKNDCIKTGKLKIICKDMVGPEDRLGMLMSKVAEIARQTNHFEQVHHLLVEGNEPADSMAVMQLAFKGGITATDVQQRLNSKETIDKIRKDYDDATSLNITATPSFVFNGKVYIGYMTYSDIISKLGIAPAAANDKSCDVTH